MFIKSHVYQAVIVSHTYVLHVTLHASFCILV